MIKFTYERQESKVFGTICRPIAEVFFRKRDTDRWVKMSLIIDSGADVTLLPKMYARTLGIDINECEEQETRGVGGSVKIYLCDKLQARLNGTRLQAKVGFVDTADLPPLLGRIDFFDFFEICFRKREIVFEQAS
ncbi:MAG: aspartyl protease family protein [Methanocellales archaeon]|nr:aspartyl protease family protein [Methanocellales archaeon]MDI6903507.1 aspartyl protease family protein [Methanocellales archaeon]